MNYLNKDININILSFLNIKTIEFLYLNFITYKNFIDNNSLIIISNLILNIDKNINFKIDKPLLKIFNKTNKKTIIFNIIYISYFINFINNFKMIKLVN